PGRIPGGDGTTDRLSAVTGQSKGARKEAGTAWVQTSGDRPVAAEKARRALGARPPAPPGPAAAGSGAPSFWASPSASFGRAGTRRWPTCAPSASCSASKAGRRAPPGTVRPPPAPPTTSETAPSGRG